MERVEEHLLKIQGDRVIFQESDRMSGCLPVVWVVLLIFFGSVILFGIPNVHRLGYEGGKVVFGSIAIFLALVVAPLLYTGGFTINRATKEVRRLGLPLFTPKPCNFEGALGVGLRHEIHRVLIKGYHDELHEYNLFFPMWNETEQALYILNDKEQALRMQQELAEILHLKALPMAEAASGQDNETYR